MYYGTHKRCGDGGNGEVLILAMGVQLGLGVKWELIRPTNWRGMPGLKCVSALGGKK